jgi:light-regulated signal transduction histidine kinase (bacteriophytochrome)
MTTSKLCSECNKELGQIHCAGCDKYFCWKDFKTHREGMFTQLDKVIEERNHLQDEINNVAQFNHQESPLIQQINEWQDVTIEKVKQVAEKVRQQAVHLLNSKQMKISTDFKDFSRELAHLKESENFVEHDLTRINQMISQFTQNLRQSTQPTTIKLHTEQSDEINWDQLIHIEGKQIYSDNQQRQPQAASKLFTEFLGEYSDHDHFCVLKK